MNQSAQNLHWATSGPVDAAIMLVGESWGAEEAKHHIPFCGSSGLELDRVLNAIGHPRNSIYCTNVVNAKPQDNEMFHFFNPKAGAPVEAWGLHPTKLIVENLMRLRAQIEAVNPKLIIAAGNYALWALTGDVSISYDSASKRLVPTGITSWRGSMLTSRPEFGSRRVLPIIHPAAWMRAWAWRHYTEHDLRLRVPQALYGAWTRPEPYDIFYKGTFRDYVERLLALLVRADKGPLYISCDTETRLRNLTCIGIGTSADSAFVIPLIDIFEKKILSRWKPHEEACLIRLLMKLAAHPNVTVIGQNFLYDMIYFAHHYGLYFRNVEDTMMRQHVLFPGEPKGLDMLSSLYCEFHRYWKDDNKEWDLKTTTDDHLLYNGEDCCRTFEVFSRQTVLLEHEGLTAQAEEQHEIEMLAFDMMQRGVRFDLQHRTTLMVELDTAASVRERFLLGLIPQHLVKTGAKTTWPFSPTQQQIVFYDILGLPVQRHRKTKQPTLNDEALNKLEENYPQFARIFTTLSELRSIGVFNKTFVQAAVDLDGRLRCSFNPGGTETYRWSSSKNPMGTGTNLQNIPQGDKE